MTETINYKYAVRYGKTNFPVFPCCWPDMEGNCACGRNHEGRNAGKVPLTINGLKDATTDIDKIIKWWTEYPLANIGIAIPEIYFVLDVDVDHEGYDSLERLQEQIGELPPTVQITTGSGGAHLWYKTNIPIKNTTQLAGYKGLDIRGTGGYVIAPPSLHRCGNRYEKSPVWNGGFSFAPERLIDLCTQKTYQPLPDFPEAWAEGTRNDRLASLAGTLRAKGLPEITIESMLREANSRQCNPPLSDNEVKGIARSYARYPANNTLPKDINSLLKTSGRL